MMVNFNGVVIYMQAPKRGVKVAAAPAKKKPVLSISFVSPPLDKELFVHYLL
jgi:hypothetical protein